MFGQLSLPSITITLNNDTILYRLLPYLRVPVLALHTYIAGDAIVTQTIFDHNGLIFLLTHTDNVLKNVCTTKQTLYIGASK